MTGGKPNSDVKPGLKKTTTLAQEDWKSRSQEDFRKVLSSSINAQDLRSVLEPILLRSSSTTRFYWWLSSMVLVAEISLLSSLRSVIDKPAVQRPRRSTTQVTNLEQFLLIWSKSQLYSGLKFRCAIFRWTGWCETKERAMQGMKKSRKVSQGVSRSQKVKYWKLKPFYMFYLEIAVLCCRTLNSCKICNHSANSQFPYISHFSILKQVNPTFSEHPCKSIFNDQEQEMLDGGYSSSSRDASVDLEKYGEKDYRKVRLIFPCIF